MFLAFLASFLIAAGLTFYFSTAKPLSIIANPTERSLHNQPTPAMGGIAIISSLFCVCLAIFWLAASTPFPPWFALSAGLIAVISVLDDCWDLSALLRLCVHIGAAVLLLWQMPWAISHLSVGAWNVTLPALLAPVISLLFIVWMTNLYNFMDGMDGIAGGMAVFGFGTFALLGFFSGHLDFCLVNGLIACASAGFLVFNFPPSRIFMGDAGASTLGFLAAGMSLWAQGQQIFPLWFALLLFSPFIVDATVTLFRRLLRGEKIWQAHRTHYYQRLVLKYRSHLIVLQWEYLLMAFCSLSVLFAFFTHSLAHEWLLLGWIGGYLLLLRIVDKQMPPPP